MDYGLALPSLGAAASREGIDAAAELAEHHGFTDVWVTDHLLVERASEAEYGRIYEAVTTLAYVAGRTRTVRLGASVIVVPMRNAVVLAKELATLDDLSGGRLTVGVGVGWDEAEFANVGAADRYHVRGAYTDEAVTLWRHLWGGSEAPFHGRFHAFDDFAFGPLPPQGARLPIWFGGRSEPALRRAGRLGDAYHASATSPEQYGPRIPVVRAAAEAAGRPMPRLTARVRVELDREATPGGFSLHGSPETVAGGIRAFAALGVDHVAVVLPERDPAGLRRAVERFVTEVRPLV